jgi:hypothetical protein
MRRPPIALLCVLAVAAAAMSFAVEAQRVDGGRRDRVHPPESIPANESYAPLTTSLFEVLSVRTSDRLVRLRGKDGRTADVLVQDHVYDVSKLKAGDKVRVDFFQPDDGDTRLRAAGVWPAP